MSATQEKGIVKSVVPERDLAQFEAAIGEYGGLACQDMGEAARVITMAQAIASVRSALTPAIMAQIMQLQGSRIGYKTDKDRNRDGTKGPGYPIEVMKDVTTEAILFGARLTGNEVNVISGSCYLTKEHFIRKLRDLPGMTDLEITFGVPQVQGDKAVVNCRAKWKMHGKDMSIGYEAADPCNISVKVYDGQGGGQDQALGKAERKLRSRILARATGTTITLPEGDLDEREAVGTVKEVQATTVSQEPPAQSSKAAAVSARMATRTPSSKAQAPALPHAEPAKPAATEKPAHAPAMADTPECYQRLAKYYLTHADMVDECLGAAGLGDPFLALNIEALSKDEDSMAMLKRAASMATARISK